MRYLLDTSTFLWWDLAMDNKLSKLARDIIEDETTTIYLSYISIWEMQIKQQIGKLSLRVPLPQLVQEQTSQNDIILMPLNEAHIYGLSQLSDHHRDPFDRLIISQAINENLTLITNDHHIQKYAVSILW